MKRIMPAITVFWKKYRKFIIGAIVLAVIGGGWYYNSKKEAELAELESTKVQKGDLKQTLILSGEVQADDTSTLRFQAGGKLTVLAVKEGDIVKKGQHIGSLDQRQLQKGLEKDLNTFMKARWNLDQKRDDYDSVDNDTIKRIIDTAQFDVNNTILDVELQSISKELANIYAPISGIVTNTYNNHPGMNVSAATDIVDVINPDSLYFALTADQTEVSALREGMTGTLTLDAFLDDTMTGSIQRISFTPKAGETSTVYEVVFIFTNSSNANLTYRTGMTGDVEFVTDERKNTLSVPLSYITEKQGKSFVRVMEDGKLLDRPVETGIEADGVIEITSGLSEGEVIYD